MTTKKHSIKLQVRDYECDMLGGAHHSNFFSWFEHARSEYVKEILGTSLRELYSKGVTFVIGRQSIEYINSLYPGQYFDIETEMYRRSQHRLLFKQKITRNEKTIANFMIIVVSISPQTLKATTSPELENILKNYINYDIDLSNDTIFDY